jgi:hypothetical protein|tara:strand:- start:92 stop:280 length:189 start_codon:yes stop_codon:yes gene_type:complete
MNLEAERKMKFDRRMEGRSGWASEEELQAELASLPDSVDKISDEDEEPAPALDADAAESAGI